MQFKKRKKDTHYTFNQTKQPQSYQGKVRLEKFTNKDHVRGYITQYRKQTR
jgi:hypothetical protein